jgi:hypothetical protein
VGATRFSAFANPEDIEPNLLLIEKELEAHIHFEERILFVVI